jgi:hypothetical protein
MTKKSFPIVATCGVCALVSVGCDAGDSEVGRSPNASAAELRIDDDPVFSIDGPGGAQAPFHEIVSAVALTNGGFAIADQTPRIVIIDQEGALIRSFGRSGDGPGEFRRVAWVQEVAGDSLLVYDPVLNRGSMFSSEGLHGRTITLEPRGGANRPPAILGVFDDGELLGGEQVPAPPPEGGSGIVRPEMIISLHNRDGAFLDSLGIVPGNERAIADGVLIGSLPLLRSTSIVMDGSAFHMATGERWEVESRDRGGVLVRTVGDGSEPGPVTQEIIESAGVPEPLIALLPTHLPAVGSIISDRHRRVWMGPHVMASQQESVSWTVFGVNGELISQVEMPSGFRPLDVGTSTAIGIWKDDLGVQNVRVYPVTGSRSEGD